ncbi:hypothetical protein O9X90_23520 [Agrobacterium leguminum]|uniref:hypothetical protein n=1 Tax=Agrobacterium leguminum TaxID=2792015 RepID=UPI0022B8502E|nr:hypothetical protein [Agrobacterium leguminum]MCZ7935302.1 hypothetical protein [Agrobacterium leguminum]
MTHTIQRLEEFAAAREFKPLADPPAPELDAVREAFSKNHARVTVYGPGNDRYAHLVDCEVGEALQARFHIRFDLRVFLLLPYIRVNGVMQLMTDSTASAGPCAPFLKILEDRGFEQVSFEDARRQLSDKMLDKGFIDDTRQAYFFESL